ncbi:hypothetical protein J6590_019667 [Homalodisca vitripennis]|nr:hypothetical protein J6590_019667 [Homalodisca vitripennis]
MPVLFFYTRPAAAAKIRKALKMDDKNGFYYDSMSSNETHRRITFLPDKIDEDCKQTLKTIFSNPENNVFAELSGKEANDILVKASPKEVQAFILKKQPNQQQQQQQQQPQPFNGQNIQTKTLSSRSVKKSIGEPTPGTDTNKDSVLTNSIGLIPVVVILQVETSITVASSSLSEQADELSEEESSTTLCMKSTETSLS